MVSYLISISGFWKNRIHKKLINRPQISIYKEGTTVDRQYSGTISCPSTVLQFTHNTYFLIQNEGVSSAQEQEPEIEPLIKKVSNNEILSNTFVL